MPGIATAHHAVRHVQTGTSKIRTTGHVDHAANGAAVHSHAKLQARALLKRTADFDRALRRRFRAGVKHQRDPVASWNFDQAI